MALVYQKDSFSCNRKKKTTSSLINCNFWHIKRDTHCLIFFHYQPLLFSIFKNISKIHNSLSLVLPLLGIAFPAVEKWAEYTGAFVMVMVEEIKSQTGEYAWL